jgi:hypothetical protein
MRRTMLLKVQFLYRRCTFGRGAIPRRGSKCPYV